jgi:hypothetical protein
MATNEEILQISNSLAYQSDFLEFYMENPFQNPILWQITWNKESTFVYKSTLFKDKMPQKKLGVWEIIREEGFFDLKALLLVVQEIQKLALPADFYCKTMGRDGHFYRLTLGDDFTNITYKWYEAFVPDKWEILNECANNLRNRLKNWVGDIKKNTKITYIEEETTKGFSIFIEQEYLNS